MNLPTRLDAFASLSRRVFLSFYIHESWCFNPSPPSPCLFFLSFCFLRFVIQRSEGSRVHKEEWMLPRSFLPMVVWMTIGSMVNRVKGLGINFRVYMYTNGMI